jgi:hypothetical protein
MPIWQMTTAGVFKNIALRSHPVITTLPFDPAVALLWDKMWGRIG